MLGHLVLVDDLADLYANVVLSSETSGFYPGYDLFEILFSRLKLVLALMSAQLRELSVPAGDETFAREVGMGELEQIAFIEQIGLDLLVIDQHPDCAAFECGNPVDAIAMAELVDRLLRDHAAVADDHQPLDAKVLSQPPHLRQEGLAIAGIAIMHADRNRAAAGIG